MKCSVVTIPFYRSFCSTFPSPPPPTHTYISWHQAVFFCSSDQIGSKPPHFWGFEIRRNRTSTTSRTAITSDQLVAGAATCTKHNRPNRRTPVPTAGFEAAIPAFKCLQIYNSDRTITGISIVLYKCGGLLKLHAWVKTSFWPIISRSLTWSVS
jgi:hypothetical protein